MTNSYPFQVKWAGRHVAAVTTVSGLSRSTHHEPVRLSRGIVTDTAFDDWANRVWFYPNTTELGHGFDVTDFRKPMQIELYSEAGELVLRYDLYQCWPSEYTALPASEGNAVALASMTIEHEGCVRDASVS